MYKLIRCIGLLSAISFTVIYVPLTDSLMTDRVEWDFQPLRDGKRDGNDLSSSRKTRSVASLALRFLLKGAKYAGVQEGARNYVKYGGYKAAEKDFDLVNFPAMSSWDGVKTGIVEDKAFILNRQIQFGGGSTDALITIGPISDPHRVETWIWYKN